MNNNKMEEKTMNATLFALTSMVIAFSLTNVAALAGTTAKAGLAQATATAKKWQPDAVLTNISTLAADANGNSEKWGYMFYSAKAKKGYSVDIRGTNVDETLEVNPHIKDAVGNE